MKSSDMAEKEVIEVEHGEKLGRVTGVLIDSDERKVIALQVSPGGLLAHAKYLPTGEIVSLGDTMTVRSKDSLLNRGEFKTAGVIESLAGRDVLTEDGRYLGHVQSYDVDRQTGIVQSITFGSRRRVLGGLWSRPNPSYTVPVEHVKTLGENVLVDNSTPEAVGMTRAA